jgi:DNA repair exonuclease SbcCD ATPase subunit
MIGLGIVMPASGQVKGDSTVQDGAGGSDKRYEKRISDLVRPNAKNSTSSAEERKAYQKTIDTKLANLKSIELARREKFTEELEDQRKKAQEEYKEKHKEFTDKLKLIRDEKKKETVENIEKRLNEINAKRTTVMTKQVDELSQKLERIIAEGAAQKADGSDTTELDKAITDAQAAITTARSAITTQASKSYSIDITTEASVGSDVRTVIAQLEKDILSTYQTVKAVRAAVLSSYKYLKVLVGEPTVEDK